MHIGRPVGYWVNRFDTPARPVLPDACGSSQGQMAGVALSAGCWAAPAPGKGEQHGEQYQTSTAIPMRVASSRYDRAPPARRVFTWAALICAFGLP